MSEETTGAAPAIDYAKAALYLKSHGYAVETPEQAEAFIAKFHEEQRASFIAGLADFNPETAKPSAADLDAAAAEQQSAEETAEQEPAPPTPEEEAKSFLANFDQTVASHAEALAHLKNSSNATIQGTLVYQAVQKFEAVATQLETLLAKLKSKL